MKVLVGCEVTGTVRDAFARAGHDALSCDLMPSETPGNHYLGDVLDLINGDYDLMIAHPPCTHTAVSGARWFKDKTNEQRESLIFIQKLWSAPIPRICLEQPVSISSRVLGPPTQIIQPWMFGHGETKKTCLWLKNLPTLRPTNIVQGREHRIHLMSPGSRRAYERSRTYTGIAEAMADQWGNQLYQYQGRLFI